MYHVYAISSLERNYIYVGLTDNLERRFFEHNTGKNKTTKPYLPFKIIYTQEFATRLEARQKDSLFSKSWALLVNCNCILESFIQADYEQRFILNEECHKRFDEKTAEVMDLICNK